MASALYLHERYYMKEKVLQRFTLPLKYDNYGQKIWDSNSQLVADIRAWGMLQHYEDGDKIQDCLGQMMVDAFNEEYYDTSN